MPEAPQDQLRTTARQTTDARRARPGRSDDAGKLAPALEPDQVQLQKLKQQNHALLRTRSLLAAKVSSLESALSKATRFAYHDELTGLPNRRLLLDRFNQATTLADRHDQGVALLFLDLNEFKRVNDKLGHAAGDELLQQVASRLTTAIRRSDTACRYGGDEFVVLLAEIDRHADAVKGLHKIRAMLAPSYAIDGHSIPLTVSDGLAIYPHDARTFADLVRLSDHSMLRNKSTDKKDSAGITRANRWRHGAGQDLCAD